jgi:sugar phosphate isomerase/epimerase
VRVGLFTDALSHMSRRDALAWCADRGLDAVELGVGGWSPRPHLELDLLLREPGERDRLQGELREHGLELACVNAAGNVLHPDPAVRAVHEGALRGALELAQRLGVGTVVTMSGSPGPRAVRPATGQIGVFAVWSLTPDDEPLWRWQFDEVVGPFWEELSRTASADAPDVRICLELHPGVTVYGVDTFAVLAERTGPNVGVNLDPSHFWWQGIDPVAVVDALGDRIGFAHGKDTTIYPDRVRLRGVIDAAYPVDPARAPWHFSAVGDGHEVGEWRRLLAALRRAGYDGVVSIEYEDPVRAPEEAIEASAATLREAMAA